jgi:uncharacterized protein YceK
MLVRRIWVVLVVAELVLVIGGCTPSIVSSDAGVYSTGRLYAVTSQDTTAVYDATLKAMEQLELDVSEAAKDVFYAKVVAKGADGKTITVRIKPKEGGGTDLRIGVGTMGDRNRSTVIYERIRQNLGLSEK